MAASKPFARAREKAVSPGPNSTELARTHAYQRLFNGNGNKEDAEVVMTDLAAFFGYYRRPTYKQWLSTRQAPAGFELHSALCNARAEVVQRIFDYVRLDDDSLVELEKAARLEARKQ